MPQYINFPKPLVRNETEPKEGSIRQHNSISQDLPKIEIDKEQLAKDQALLSKSKGFLKPKKITSYKQLNRCLIHLLEETPRGDLQKVAGLIKFIQNDKEQNSTFVWLFGKKVFVQMNEMLNCTNGSKEVFVLRTGAGNFTALTLDYLSKRFFEEAGDVKAYIDEKKDKAIHLSSMTINEKQIYKDTLKRIIEKGMDRFKSLASWGAVVLVAFIMAAAFIYMINKGVGLHQQDVAAGQQFLKQSAQLFNQSVQRIVAGG